MDVHHVSVIISGALTEVTPEALKAEPQMTSSQASLPSKLTGNISELRSFVGAKFNGGKPVVKAGKMLKLRHRSKMPDKTGAYHRFAARCFKRPAVAHQTDVCEGGWTGKMFMRKSGEQAGKEYKIWQSPEGTVYSSKKKAVMAGYTVS